MKTLILKYLTHSITKAELKKLREWLKNANNKDVFKAYFRDAYTLNRSYDNVDVDKAFRKVCQEIKQEEKPLKRLIPNWTKYAAAAILVFGLGFFFKDNLFETKMDNPPIIVNNNIKTGTDKATLTLEGGEKVALEKGNAYQNQNAVSNGEEIVYKADPVSKEIAYHTLTIPRGGQYVVKLADGTQVWLNSESQLKYPVAFVDGETRTVDLVYGEAYFDISPSTDHHGAGFKVYHDKQEVEVLGTEFNIKAYRDEDHIYTTLAEGKVVVNYLGNKQNLVPNQQSHLNLNTNILSIVTVDVYNEISWKDGVFSFDNKSLKDIMKVLSRWYDMDLTYFTNELKDDTFFGVFGKEQNIEDVLNSIKETGIIKAYEIHNKTIILK